MLLQFRKTTRGFVATIIFGLVGLATVIFLIPQSGITQLGGATAIAEVSGRKITPTAGVRRREGKRRPSSRNALTVWCAEPTRAKVSKNRPSGSQATAAPCAEAPR